MTRCYFAFPDGVLHYECAHCDALCCRGGGIGAHLERDVPFLLEQYPALAGAAIQRRGAVVEFQNPSGACFFLRGDRLCRIETDHGRARKPMNCRLFPFNGFVRVGDVLVVTPHYHCPLRAVVPPAPGQVEGTHAHLEAAIRESGVLEALPFPTITLPEVEARKFHERETAFRDACGAALGHRTLGGVLRQFSPSSDLETVVARVGRLLAWDTPHEERAPDGLDATMLTLAPHLRLVFCRLSESHRMITLALAERYLRAMQTVNDRPLTLQAAYSLLDARSQTLKLLARGDAPIYIPEGFCRDEAPDNAYKPVLEALSPVSGKPLLAAVEDALMTLAPLQRTLLLGMLGQRLEPLQPNV